MIEDAVGNEAATFTTGEGGVVAVTNNSTAGADTTPPALISATVGAFGTQLNLDFNEAFAVPSSYTTLASRFAVRADGASVSFSLLAASQLQLPAGGRLVLSLSTAIERDQVVVVTYTDPTTGDDANVIEDAAGNELATFTTGQAGVVAVTNNSTCSTPLAPTVVSVTVRCGLELGMDQMIAIRVK